MTAKDLAALGRHAHAWARTYTAIKDALLKEGVTEKEAREEAHNAANMAAMWEPDSGEACPLCGK